MNSLQEQAYEGANELFDLYLERGYEKNAPYETKVMLELTSELGLKTIPSLLIIDMLLQTDCRKYLLKGKKANNLPHMVAYMRKEALSNYNLDIHYTDHLVVEELTDEDAEKEISRIDRKRDREMRESDLKLFGSKLTPEEREEYINQSYHPFIAI